MKYFKSIVGSVIIILGIIAICFGWSVFYSGGYVSTKSYGGDAYTGIQNAAAATANRVNNFATAYLESYGFFMTFIGISMICGGTLTVSYNVIELKGNKKERTKKS